MLSSALLSLGVAGSVLAWPSHPRHASIARAIQAREEPVGINPTKAPVAATWFASWHAQEFPLSNVSWSKYTTVTYSFALTTPNVSFVNITDPEVFKDFVQTAHANNCSASISVGGWTGSQYFSTAVATAENRTEFVKTMTNLVKDNNLDGLDFDWEYPGLAGIGCNTLSANDTDNFLAFLTELRAALPNTTLSAAASIKPFMSDLTTPSTNVSAFAKVFDYIAIMNYDIWGPWSDAVGPNAPLNDTCAVNATQKVGSAVSAIEAWTKAGIPADQLVLGVAGYGRGYSVAQTDALTGDNTISLYAPFNKTSIPAGDEWDVAPAPGAVDVCGKPQTLGGTWNFWGLVEGGYLNENGTANTAAGIAYKFDECSQTPYVYNKTSGIMVSFDDATSFAAKGKFINATGLRGFAMWEAAGDFDDILLDSIRTGAGFPTVEDDEEECEEDPSTGTTTDAAPAPTSTAASQPTTEAGNPSGGEPTTKPASGGASTYKAPAAAAAATTPAATTKAAAPTTASTRSAAASNPEPTANPDDDDDDDECEDDEDPETSSVAAATTAAATSAPAATAQATSVAESSSATLTSSAAAAAATGDPEEECDDDDEY